MGKKHADWANDICNLLVLKLVGRFILLLLYTLIFIYYINYFVNVTYTKNEKNTTHKIVPVPCNFQYCLEIL